MNDVQRITVDALAPRLRSTGYPDPASRIADFAGTPGNISKPFDPYLRPKAITVGVTRMTSRNNFDFLRVALALFVILAHSRLIGQVTPFSFLSLTLAGYVAVQCFFVISGFLIFQSWDKAKTLREYTSKRVRRIYPAYFVVVVSSALLGGLLSTVPLAEYFGSVGWLKYMAANLTFLNFLQPTLPGLFVDGDDSLVNGPLWTIKVEVMFYTAVPIIAWLAAGKRRPFVFLLIYLSSVVWAEYFRYLYDVTGNDLFLTLVRQLPGQMALFVVGGALYFYFDYFKKFAPYLVITSIGVLALDLYFPLPWIYPAALGIIVIYVAQLAPYFGNFGRHGDFSYGIYILHYPILQSVRALGVFESSPMMAFAVGGLVTVLLAYVSWHLIEKPWLLSSSHYRRATETEVPDARVMQSSSQKG